MKKYSILAIMLVLTAAVLTGCRRGGNDMSGATDTTMMPTAEMPTVATTEAATIPTTMPTMDPSESTMESETETVGTDGFVDTNPTESISPRGRSRKMPGIR